MLCVPPTSFSREALLLLRLTLTNASSSSHLLFPQGSSTAWKSRVCTQHQQRPFLELPHWQKCEYNMSYSQKSALCAIVNSYSAFNRKLNFEIFYQSTSSISFAFDMAVLPDEFLTLTSAFASTRICRVDL